MINWPGRAFQTKYANDVAINRVEERIDDCDYGMNESLNVFG